LHSLILNHLHHLSIPFKQIQKQPSVKMQLTIALLTAVLALTVTAAPPAAPPAAAPPAPAPPAPAPPATAPQGNASQGAAPQGKLDKATISALVPEFGVVAGQNPSADKKDCTTTVAPAKIPCDCPPPREKYIDQLVAAVQAGNTFGLPAQFPTGNDKQSQIVRFQTMLAVLQSVRGEKGKGCPAISTTYKKDLDKLTGAAAAGGATNGG
jgi:hypothetical protein